MFMHSWLAIPPFVVPIRGGLTHMEQPTVADESFLAWVNTFADDTSRRCEDVAFLSDGLLLSNTLKEVLPSTMERIEWINPLPMNDDDCQYNLDIIRVAMEQWFSQELQRSIQISAATNLESYARLMLRLVVYVGKSERAEARLQRLTTLQTNHKDYVASFHENHAEQVLHLDDCTMPLRNSSSNQTIPGVVALAEPSAPSVSSSSTPPPITPNVDHFSSPRQPLGVTVSPDNVAMLKGVFPDHPDALIARVLQETHEDLAEAADRLSLLPAVGGAPEASPISSIPENIPPPTPTLCTPGMRVETLTALATHSTPSAGAPNLGGSTSHHQASDMGVSAEKLGMLTPMFPQYPPAVIAQVLRECGEDLNAVIPKLLSYATDHPEGPFEEAPPETNVRQSLPAASSPEGCSPAVTVSQNPKNRKPEGKPPNPKATIRQSLEEHLQNVHKAPSLRSLNILADFVCRVSKDAKDDSSLASIYQYFTDCVVLGLLHHFYNPDFFEPCARMFCDIVGNEIWDANRRRLDIIDNLIDDKQLFDIGDSPSLLTPKSLRNLHKTNSTAARRIMLRQAND